ncbi:RNA polymerase sigma factor [Asanoa ishikariensis]|uniref:RNA polymerase sigma factor n=1 Tax=Asanoa ishikariensis TaxID=137265 RepID=UPI0015A0AC56|nr:sigma factor [Asanoa ishikariensis]
MAPDDTDFGEFVELRYCDLLRIAYLLTGSAHDAEDLVQSASVKVLRRWHKIDESRRLPAPHHGQLAHHRVAPMAVARGDRGRAARARRRRHGGPGGPTTSRARRVTPTAVAYASGRVEGAKPDSSGSVDGRATLIAYPTVGGGWRAEPEYSFDRPAANGLMRSGAGEWLPSDPNKSSALVAIRLGKACRYCS